MGSAYVDPLFEFDAPQRFVDLAAAASRRHDPRARDAWFDAPHDAHARPSAELARELAAALERQQKQREQLKHREQHKQREQLKLREHVKQTEQRSPGSEKENRDERARGGRTGTARGKFVSLRDARSKQRPFEAARARAAAAKEEGKKRMTRSPEAVGKKRTDAAASVTERERKPLGSLGAEDKQKQPKKPQQQKKQQEKQQRAKRPRTDAESGMSDELKELLARHNKKIKAARHTYEPPRHTIRDVRMWERETKQSYYEMNAQERQRANEEIAEWLKERRAAQLAHN